MVNNYEKEKFDLQKLHTKAFQDLVDETNIRLKKVESEYNEQQNLTEKVINELENRIILLKNEMDKNSQISKNLEFELKNKNSQIDILSTKVKEITSKNSIIENEYQILRENHSKDISNIESIFKSKGLEYENTIKNLNQQINDVDKSKTNLEKKNEKLNIMLK
jgi:hypothetical protein